MGVLECPYTKAMMEKLIATDDADERGYLICYLRSQICGSPTNRTVCCDIDNGEYSTYELCIGLQGKDSECATVGQKI